MLKQYFNYLHRHFYEPLVSFTKHHYGPNAIANHEPIHTSIIGDCKVSSNNLKSMFFPVVMRPIYWERDCEDFLYLQECERHYAIIAKDKDQLFTVASNSYSLVLNEQAYQLLLLIFQTIMDIEDINSIAISDAMLICNRAVCYIEVCRSEELYQPVIADYFYPTISATNSYNKTRQLHFVLGFKSIDGDYIFCSELKIPHTKSKDNHSALQAWLQGLKNDKYLQKNITLFKHKIEVLRHTEIKNKGLMLRLYSKYFEVYYNKEKTNKTVIDSNLSMAERIIDNVCNTHGMNGFSLLIAFGRIISQQKSVVYNSTDLIKLGKWSDELVRNLAKKDFSWHDYIGKNADDTIYFYE